jgi:phospholipid transport system substrate-binding protein
MKTWAGLAVSVVLLMIAQVAMALSPVGPRQTVEASVAQVLSVLAGAADATLTTDRPAEVRRIAREIFDFDEVSKRALARHWQTLTPAEQVEFVTLFTDLLEHSYMSQVGAYSGQTITFTGEAVEGDVALVRSKLVSARGSEIPLDFRVHVRDGRWLVYDVLVGGMSFVGIYRSQFDRVIRTESYAALRDRLQKKNLDTAVASERRVEGM